jgi:hypothetical protein
MRLLDKLARVAAEIDKWNEPPEDWYRWATIGELSALGAADRERPEHRAALEEIRERCLQRHRLRLEVSDIGCFAKRPNPACYCGEQALERLSAAELATLDPSQVQERLRKLASPHHKKRRHFLAHQAAKSKPKAAAPAVPAPDPIPEPNVVTETATRPDLKPRPQVWRQKGERAHPLSWRAFRDREAGRMDWLDPNTKF